MVYGGDTDKSIFTQRKVYMKKNVLCIAALACAADIYATEPVDNDKSVVLLDVQVTSTRADKRTPVAFTNFDRKQIEKANFGKDIPQLLSLTPSVTTTSDAGNGIGYTSIRVRGVDPSRINITSNGIPVNDAESSQVYFVNMGDLVSSMQSMQIQRGCGTSTNGAGAFGATINMQTENIGAEPFIGIDLSGGSYYSHKETLRFGTGLIGNHFGLQGRVSDIGSHGYLERAHTALKSYFIQAGYFNDNTVLKFITYSGKEKTYHAWNYASKYEQSLYGRRYNSCGEYYDNDGNRHYYDNQTDNYRQYNYQLIWNQILGKAWNLNVALHYTRGNGYYEEYKADDYNTIYGPTDDIYDSSTSNYIRQKKMENDFYGTVASINYKPNERLKATVGGGWNKYVGDHFGIVTWTDNPNNALTPAYEYYRDRAKKTDANIYGKAEWEFTKGLNAYVDLQYRHVGYRMQDPGDHWKNAPSAGLWAHDDFDFFNPKFGFNYQVNANNRLYVSYGMSHKEPTRNDYQDNYVQHLSAEKLQDVELGYKYASTKFSAGVNLYYMYYNNQYVLTGKLNDIGEMIASNDNSGRSYRTGIELEAAWKPVSWFRWDANATFSRNRNKDWNTTIDQGGSVNLGSTHTSFSPSAVFNNILTFTYKGFEANIQNQFVGEQYLTNTDCKYYTNYNADGTVDRQVGMTLDSFFITNLDLSYSFDTKKTGLRSLGMKELRLGISLYNLFSVKYDNNGWAAPNYRLNNGTVEAYCTDNLYMAGFAPSAPFNCMAHLSVRF